MGKHSDVTASFPVARVVKSAHGNTNHFTDMNCCANLEGASAGLTLHGASLQTLFPFSEDYVSSMVLEAPGLGTAAKLPRLEVSREILPAGTQLIKIQPKLPGPGYFGSINVTGPILNWSLPKPVDPGKNTVRLMSMLSLPTSVRLNAHGSYVLMSAIDLL